MSAVGALAGVGVPGRMGQDAGIIFLLLRGRLVRYRLLHMLRGVVTRQNAGHRRPGQGVVDALNRCQGHAEGRGFRREQPSPRVAFHHRDSHVLLLADPVELRPVRMNAAQALLILLRKAGV